MLSIDDTYFYKQYRCGTKVRVNAQSSDLEAFKGDERVEYDEGDHLVLKLDKPCHEFYCDKCH